MNLQVIKSVQGQPEYVLLPIAIYQALHDEIEKKLKLYPSKSQYVLFKPEDYVDNPVALARIKANITQQALAKRLGVTQAYISKIENQATVTPKLLKKVYDLLNKTQNTHE